MSTQSKCKHKQSDNNKAPTPRYPPPAGYEIGQSGVHLVKPDGERVTVLNFPLWVSDVCHSADVPYAMIEWITPLGQHRKDSIPLHLIRSDTATLEFYEWLVSHGIDVPE